MAQVLYQQNKQKAKQVLILYAKLLNLQESCWGQLFLFEKTPFFQSFNKRCRLKGNQLLFALVIDVLEIRLEDLIYLVILAGLMVMFNVLAPDSGNTLFKGYRIFCIMLFLASVICLMVRPGIKYLVLLIFCVFIPVTMNGVYSKWLTLDPAQTLDNYSILGYLSMLIVYGFVIIVYPLKSFIQQKIGSLYSYLYGLSFITLFGLWPFYSILNEMSSSGSITLSIIYNNKALVITFIVIIVFSFYLMVHRTFFEGDKEKLYQILRSTLTSQEVSRAMQQMEENEIKEYEWHNVTSRVMSVIVLATTLGLEIFIFFNMANETRNMIKSAGLMVFAIVFLVMGTFYIVLPLSNKIAIPLFAILSLCPAPFVFFNSSQFSYWQYLCTIFSLPYVVLFWSVLRSISQYRPLLQNKILTIMYTLVHIPVMVFMMDVLDYFGSGDEIGPVGYIAMIVVAGTIVIGLLIEIVLLCVRVCSVKTESTRNTNELDFNYQQPLNYQPYKKLNSFSLSWVSQLDLLDLGVFLNTFFYLTSNTVAFYSLKQLTYTYTPSYFYSPTIYEITYSQFIILLVFMLYCNYFMTTNNDSWDFWMLGSWLMAGLVCVVMSYVLTVVPNMFRLIGGFCLAMFFIALALQYIKDSNKKILNFVTPILSISLWITVVIPYVVGIPTASIYVDQADFGIFVYNCILASALLLIVLVGIVSMIFNILMNKFEEEKRYKYVIQDVKHFFDEQGVDSGDQVLNVFYQAYACRDKKYIFYLKNGYPINVIKDEQTDAYKLVTYDKVINSKTTQNIPKPKEKEVDCVWSCLTFFCGQDEQEINDKVKNALEKKLIDQEQAENLFPQDKFEKFNKMMQTRYLEKNKDHKPPRIKPEDISSTKSLLLNSMSQGPRRLGPQYTLLKLEKSRKLGLQIWDSIFQLVSNPDKGENMVIYNDFRKFCEASKIQMSGRDCEQLFNKYAKSSWGDTVALREEEFATALEDIADKCYRDVVQNQNQRIMYLLVDKVYYNLSRFQQFTQTRRQKSQFSLSRSGFINSLQRYKQSSLQRQKQLAQLVHFYKKQKNFLDQPRKQYQLNYVKKKRVQRNVSQQVIEETVKGKSCKKSLYDSYLKCRDSCSSTAAKQQAATVKKQRIKPWSYLAVQSAKILHRKQTLWQDQHQTKQYQFRLILNNIFMAVFKLADLYTYLEITIRDPQVKWYDGADFSFLYIDYKYQLYLCLGLAFVTVPLGMKGISFISEDRLGLTQARVPAGFPHPMFFYTVIYKLLVLSLFVSISSTFLVTFSCSWTETAPYKLYQDLSIQCLSTEHNIYIMLSLIFLLIYFPLSSYTFPNFQFSEKRLDLKYRPSYLVLYFQINFVLVANKVLLSEAGSSSSTVQIAFISINIFSLAFLSLVCLKMKPCLIEWFNWIEFLSIFLGLIWNIGGLVLYLTKMWTLCVIIFGGLSVVAIIVVLLIIKKVYFSTSSVNVQNDEDQVRQLQLGRKYKQSKQKMLIAQREMLPVEKLDDKTLNTIPTQNGLNIVKKNQKDLIVVDDLISNTEGGEQHTVQSSVNM